MHSQIGPYLNRIFGILFCASTALMLAQPVQWQSVGIGGGGALFSPSISPYNSQEIYVACDMTDLFHSINSGESWEVIPFSEIRSFPEAEVQFTSDPDLLYALHFDFVADRKVPVISTDGGRSWSSLSNDPTEGEAYYLFADPGSTQRLVVSSYERIFYSNNGGISFQDIYTNTDNDGAYIAGVFWQDNEIYIGVAQGILVSNDDGTTFQLNQYPGISNAEGIVSFSASKSENTFRFYAVTLNRDDIYPTVSGAEHWGFISCYTLDFMGVREWTSSNSGFGPDDHPFFVRASLVDPDIAYIGGGNGESAYPIIFKTVDGGQNWIDIFKTENNQNITTGWSGYQGDVDWWYGEYVLGLAISSVNPDVVVFTDLGFVHSSRDGGENWQQNYVRSKDQNPSGQPTPKGLSYQGNGLENTSCWWLTWLDADNIFASFTDITAIRSLGGGESWSRDYSNLDYNSVYQVVKMPTSKTLYAAVSSIHDIYQSTYLQDEDFEGGEGAIMYSTNGGQDWEMLHDFGKPVIWLTPDSNDPNGMYASVVSNDQGDIYVTKNLDAGSLSVWSKLASPARTDGHPLSIYSLNDNTLVVSYSGKRSSSGDFTKTSGVFISEDGGQTWIDRSDPGMNYWTKDLVVDPHDPDQNTWYVGVHSGWGGAPNGLGGLYKTENRGKNWIRILDLDRVESCTISPDIPDVMYVTTEAEGLWYTELLNAPDPNFQFVSSYPFQHPMRVFFDPNEIGKVWVTSFGNGIRVGSTDAVLATQIRSDQLNFMTYPNPTRDELNIEVHNYNSEPINIALVDLNGKIVQEIIKDRSFISSDIHLDSEISDLPAGIYFFKIWNKSALGMEKLIVLK